LPQTAGVATSARRALRGLDRDGKSGARRSETSTDGSVSDSVVRHAHRPVLVVRTKQEQAA
jgi:nucleotide-binding universal stress UspA family protein